MVTLSWEKWIDRSFQNAVSEGGSLKSSLGLARSCNILDADSSMAVGGGSKDTVCREF